jgi:hypothetical protein
LRRKRPRTWRVSSPPNRVYLLDSLHPSSVAYAAQRADTFDANIMAYDPNVPAEQWSELPHRRVASLAEMLPDVDILSLHLPLSTESHDMIDSAALALIKPTAVVVNTSRGGKVNEAALYQAISSGRTVRRELRRLRGRAADGEPSAADAADLHREAACRRRHGPNPGVQLDAAEQLFEAPADGLRFGRVA